MFTPLLQTSVIARVHTLSVVRVVFMNYYYAILRSLEISGPYPISHLPLPSTLQRYDDLDAVSMAEHVQCNFTGNCTNTYDSYIHVHAFARPFTYMYIHTLYMHTCIHAYMHTCIDAYIHICIHAYVHAYIHTNMHTYIQTCIHAFL